jgi:phosphoglycolate phosphatase
MLVPGSSADHPGKPGLVGAITPDQVRLILFDLDGTLVDSVGDLAWCADEMRRRLNLLPAEPGAASTWVGNGIERFVKRALTLDMNAEPGAGLYAAGFEIFSELYAAHGSDRSQVYPGVFEALRYLAGLDLRLACVTNKPEPYTSNLIAAMGLGSCFELVVAGDTTARKKPDPMPLHYAADKFGLDYASCVMVGDSSNDVRAARAAGFGIICVPYGYNHGQDIRASEPDLVVENLIELTEIFGRNV